MSIMELYDELIQLDNKEKIIKRLKEFKQEYHEFEEEYYNKEK